jgi:hypothetical protein
LLLGIDRNHRLTLPLERLHLLVEINKRDVQLYRLGLEATRLSS